MNGFRPTRRWLTRAALGTVAAVSAPDWLSAALAQGAGGTLRIGMAAPNTTLDPHFQSNAPNNAVNSHIFDALVTNDAQSGSKPGLAESWKALDDTHWEFKLRQGVNFSDGTAFAAEDAIASIQRANDLPSTSSFRTYTRSIKAMTAKDANTLLIETTGPDPLLPNSLSRIRIISADHKDAPTTEFNNGNAAIGTGALILQEYQPGTLVRFSRNDNWWAGRLPWTEVALRMMTDDGARLAALLSGDLDIIEAVPSQGTARVKQNERFHLIRGISSRFVYFAMDQKRDVTPFVTDNAGKPLEKNPFRDVRVRQALSMAINRPAITERVMMGTGSATGQWLPPGSFSALPELGLPAYDPVRAKALLAEAGFPDGFRMTLSTANDRTPYAAEITQAVAQMWMRIGVQTAVEAVPFSVYSARGARQQFSAYFGSLNNPSMEAGLLLRNLLMTVDATKGTGTYNWSRYSNPSLDALSARAISTLDDTRREQLLRQAAHQALDDVAFIPLYQFQNIWAARKGIGFEARADELTLATGAHATPQ